MLKINLISRRSFSAYCDKLRNLLKVAEEEYYSFKFYSLNKDHMKNWKVLNNILNKSTKSNQSYFVIDGNDEVDEERNCNTFLERTQQRISLTYTLKPLLDGP